MNIFEAAYKGMEKAVREINEERAYDDAVCACCSSQAALPDSRFCEGCEEIINNQ